MSDQLFAGVPAIGEPGRAARELPPGPPPHAPDSTDHALSSCALPAHGVQVRAASIRGLLHRYRTQPRQDRYSVVYDEDPGTLVVTVCDGVGSLPMSHLAADLVTAHMPRAFGAHRDWAKAVAVINQQLLEFAGGWTEAHAERGGMATTFVGLAVDLRVAPDAVPTAVIAWTDDSSVWWLRDGIWTELTTSSPTDPAASADLHTGSVRALPHATPRLRTIDVPIDRGALFVMTDGVGVPLGGSHEVRETLARWWAVPPDEFEFGRQVGFARKGHMDDRTVVGIWFPEPGAERE